MFNEQEYSLNKDFQDCTIQLADSLDLDEIESAKLLLIAQDEDTSADRSVSANAAILFHQHNHFLLECLRLILVIAIDLDIEDEYRNACQHSVETILGSTQALATNGADFILRCLKAMLEREERLTRLAQRLQGAVALGDASSKELNEINRFEEQSLLNQHESLTGIISLLAKASYSSIETFKVVYDRMSRLDRWNRFTIHYCALILVLITQHGSPEANGDLNEARSLHEIVLDQKDTSNWILRYLQAAVQTWWLAEYSGWYTDQHSNSPLPNVDFDEESRKRSQLFFQALKEGAFQCTLTMCSQTMSSEIDDSATTSLVTFLLRDAPLPQSERLEASDWFQLQLAEQLQSFVDCLITNMPDTLRQFRSEEDEQRKRIYSKLSNPEYGVSLGQDLHLERFMVITSFAFKGRAEAAQCFWGDHDSNLYGFLQWAARRQSTPCVSAFCELLQAISGTTEFSTAAHRFLLDEETTSQAKLRRRGSLSWAQILEEFSMFTSRVRDTSTARVARKVNENQSDSDDIVEPESALMLENYLRLLTHLCFESGEARDWVLGLSIPHIMEILCAFCTINVPGRLQAQALAAMRSLLTAKTPDTASFIWTNLDAWAYGFGHSMSATRPQKIANPATWFEEVTVPNILTSFEQLNEFARLLTSLLHPFGPNLAQRNTMPFPENLGSTYRMVGVQPYVDLIMKAILDGKTHVEDSVRSRVLSNSILQLMIQGVVSFDEQRLILVSKHVIEGDPTLSPEALLSYVKMHPFTRFMDWMSDDRISSWVFSTLHLDIDEIATCEPHSITTQCITSGMEIVNLVLDLQSTYLSAVRPLLKNHNSDAQGLASSTTSGPFEEKLVQHSQVISDVALFIGLGNPTLITASLALLRKLASFRKPQTTSKQLGKPQYPADSLIRILHNDEDIESLTRPLNAMLRIDPQEIDQGPASPGYSIKYSSLDFLLQALSSSSNKPSLAHALLGFQCGASSVSISPDSTFAAGASLFHTIISLAIAFPDGRNDEIEIWAIRLRRMATQVLSILWSAKLTSALVMPELQENGFLLQLMIREHPLGLSFHGQLNTLDAHFPLDESAHNLEESLQLRCLLFEYIATEIRFIEVEKDSLARTNVLSILHGSIPLTDGEFMTCPKLIDLSDFFDLQLPISLEFPALQYLGPFDIGAIYEAKRTQAEEAYSINLMEAMLDNRLQNLRRQGKFEDPLVAQGITVDGAQIVSFVHNENHRISLTRAAEGTLKAWCQAMALTLQLFGSDAASYDPFVGQIEQILTPKLEVLATHQDHRAIYIAKLLRLLITTLETVGTCDSDDLARQGPNDRAYQVFRAAMRASAAPEIDSALRLVLNQICYSYLVQTIANSAAPFTGQKILHTVKTTGMRYVSLLCDEALEAGQAARLTAILLLDAYCTVAGSIGKAFVIDALVENNFLHILVESIELVPPELRETSAQGGSFPTCKSDSLVALTSTYRYP